MPGARFPAIADTGPCLEGRGSRALAGSDLCALGEGERLLNVDTQIPHTAFYPGVANLALMTGTYLSPLGLQPSCSRRSCTGQRTRGADLAITSARSILLTMTNIETIIERRRGHSRWDPELWDFVERVAGVPREHLNDRSVEPRPLEHLSDAALQIRLEGIERNIQYLDGGDPARDEWPPEDGWLSPWWWLRLRQWTLSEFARRGLHIQATTPVVAAAPLRGEFQGIHSGSAPKLFRISRLPFLMDTLERGHLRFGLAKGYERIENDIARADDEMTKGYKRSGRQVTITTIDGRPVTALSDVSFDTSRMTSEMVELPYWMLCLSTDFDPRLFAEFPSDEGDDGVIAIFDPDEFMRRVRCAIAVALPGVAVSAQKVFYYDVYHPPRRNISPVSMKTMKFAYQRELRIVLDPGLGEPIADGAFTIDVGSVENIAAVYAPDGGRVAGTGPATFLS